MTYLGSRIGETERAEENPLTGFREWQVDVHGCLLAFGSRTADVWRPESVAVAECRATWAQGCTPGWTPHVAPTAESRCGLHAHTNLGRSVGAGRFHGAIGAVCAWGRIVLHQRGFRAQYARPIGLLATGEELVRRAAGRYCLPVLSREELVVHAATHAELATRPSIADPWSEAPTMGETLRPRSVPERSADRTAVLPTG